MHDTTRRTILLSGVATLAAPFVSRLAQAADAPIRIGVLGDMNGPYSSFSGVNTIAAAKLAIEDFAKLSPGIPVEVVSADFQLKPDVGLTIARSWFDQGNVDCIIDVPLSSLALALVDPCKEKNKVALFTGSATEDLTNKACSPNHVHWTYDSYAMATTVAHALLKKKLGRARRERGHQAGRRKRGRLGPPSVPRHTRLLELPATGAGQRRQRHLPRQCRRRSREHREAGQGVRHRA